MSESGEAERHEERPLGRTGLTGPVSQERPVSDGDLSDASTLKVRLAIRNNRLQDLAGELAEARAYAGEFQAVRESLEERLSAVSDERDRSNERIRELEYEARRQTQSRESLEREAGQWEARYEELRATIDGLQKKLEDEYELRRSLAEPENRLRAGIELFNQSEHLGAVGSLSRSMGQPEVHVTLGPEEEPAAIIYFTWQDIAWQTYISNPGLAVEEPRVYLQSSGEDLSGLSPDPPNAHIGPGGRLYLGV